MKKKKNGCITARGGMLLRKKKLICTNTFENHNEVDLSKEKLSQEKVGNLNKLIFMGYIFLNMHVEWFHF